MINKVMNRITASLRPFKSQKGQTLVEYSLVLSFISVLSVTYLNALSVEIRGLFLTVISAISAAGMGQ